MSARYLVPGIAGALVAFLVRLVFADLATALVGVVVFALVYAVILLLARKLAWQDAPVLYAATAAIAATIAFAVTHARS